MSLPAITVKAFAHGTEVSSSALSYVSVTVSVSTVALSKPGVSPSTGWSLSAATAVWVRVASWGGVSLSWIVPPFRARLSATTLTPSVSLSSATTV